VRHHRLALLLPVILLAACTSSVSQTPVATSNAAAPSLISPTPTMASPTPTATACATGRDAASNHQAPEIEAVLPSSVAGRSLAKWSLRGRCWLEVAFNESATIDALLAAAETPDDPKRIDVANLAYAVAGRSNTSSDPPFFVYATARPQDEDEIALALYLFFGGALFHDPEAASNTSLYETRTIAGRQVYVGTTDMLDQTEHQRGRPYLYETDQYLFLVITDEDAWAADAIEQLP
jgi:hypothetical protein